MPLYSYKSLDAIKTRKTNNFSSWPHRDDMDNRVEPLAKPYFGNLIEFTPGDNVFTIGSCFARNIEQELEERGFNIPTLEWFRNSEFSKINPSILNNYGVPSIAQELAWAFSPHAKFDPRLNLIEIFPNKWIDLHLPVGVKPESFENVLKRRQSIISMTQKLASCKVIIITLGLSEVWFDSESGFYLNESIRPSLAKRYPDRFELHVLSSRETYEHLKTAMDLIKKHGHPEVRVILTVSPIPFAATHRNTDVMIANCYSKSVLRVAAEEICAQYDFVRYFPSYESITLSNRELTWREDLIHVHPDIVRLNVDRLLKACITTSDSNNLTIEDIQEMVEKVQSQGVRPQWNLFNQYFELIKKHPDMALRYARLSLTLKKITEASSVIPFLDDVEPHYRRSMLEAEIQLANQQYQSTLDLLDGLSLKVQPTNVLILRAIFRIKLQAFLGLREVQQAIASALNWSKQSLGQGAYLPFLILARGLKDLSKMKEAVHYFKKAAEIAPERTAVLIELAEALILAGYHQECEHLLDRIEPMIDTPGESRKFNEIRNYIVKDIAN